MLTTCNGCFDGPIIHPGHTFFLGYAAAQADELVVGINSDDYIVRHKRTKPFCNQEERQKRLIKLEFIKDVIIFDEENPIEFIKKVIPDVHCTGEEYLNRCAEKEFCLVHGIKLVFVPRVGTWATANFNQ